MFNHVLWVPKEGNSPQNKGLYYELRPCSPYSIIVFSTKMGSIEVILLKMQIAT